MITDGATTMDDVHRIDSIWPGETGGPVIDSIAFSRDARQFQAHLATWVAPAIAPKVMNEIARAWLHPYELDRYAHLPVNRRQRSFLFGRMVAKAALSEWGIVAEPCEVAITSGVFGQPVVHGSTAVGLSLSHTGNHIAAVACDAECPLGLDIEVLDPRRSNALERVLTAGMAQLTEFGVELPYEMALFSLWTQREALGKAIRIGLTAPETAYTLAHAAWDTHTQCLRSTFSTFTQFECETIFANRWVMSLAHPKNWSPTKELIEIVSNKEDFR
ncbi:holo-[acyl-carrier-protein] synthase [Propionibacterium ruminifibrarum]|uniref:Holo-[acyl-carrier-protein] synthase n=2 Tax=Propionibacterium ruminifibrarum TaxID=1962131 RepID=A0A375I5J7_9ACTN|nr:holo-[acyl-carrier-protein] synthase [Propionibacterium ruminifibrarum]